MLPPAIIKHYRVRDGSGFKLANIDPDDKGGFDKAEAFMNINTRAELSEAEPGPREG